VKPSQALAPIGSRLALLAMILAVVLSARVGVENLSCVVRGIIAFVATLWVFRFGAGLLDLMAPSPQAGEAPEPPERAAGEPSS
jgi:hypothetical protein